MYCVSLQTKSIQLINFASMMCETRVHQRLRLRNTQGHRSIPCHIFLMLNHDSVQRIIKAPAEGKNRHWFRFLLGFFGCSIYM